MSMKKHEWQVNILEESSNGIRLETAKDQYKNYYYMVSDEKYGAVKVFDVSDYCQAVMYFNSSVPAKDRIYPLF